MKLHLALGLLTAVFTSPAAMADVHALKGSDTLAGVMTDAIIASGLDTGLQYLGGGSGLGETALVAAEQGVAPMSREMKPEKLAEARARGVEPVGHVIGLDGIGIFVNGANNVVSMSLETVKKIYTCEYTQWEQVPFAALTGAIRAYRRNDRSGTTDAFKHLVGVTTFGACVTVLAETVDIAFKTESEAAAVGYSGMTARREGNRAVALKRDTQSAAVLPTIATIRANTYPLARKLYVYEATGAQLPNEAENELLDKLLDRSFLDPIMQDNEFYTLD